MLTPTIKRALLEEFVQVYETPANRGKFIAVATLVRRLENKYGVGFCRPANENEILAFLLQIAEEDEEWDSDLSQNR